MKEEIKEVLEFFWYDFTAPFRQPIRVTLGTLIGRTYCNYCFLYLPIDTWAHDENHMESCDRLCERCGKTTTWCWRVGP